MGKQRKYISRQERIKSLKEKQVKEQAYLTALEKSGKRNKKERVLVLINGIYTKQVKRRDLKTSSEYKLYNIFDNKKIKADQKKTRALHSVYTHLYLQGCNKLLGNEELLDGIKNVVMYRFEHSVPFVREFSKWKPNTRNPYRQFEDFVQYCWGKYTVPNFMNKVWFEQDTEAQRWFIQLGQGVSVRKLENMPYNLTKKMAHFFTQAPESLTIPQAVRWSQALGFGASHSMALKIANTRLPRLSLKFNGFWETVVQFFARHEELSMNQMMELLDYLNCMIHENPEYSMSKRKVEVLIKQSEEWHKQMGYSKKKKRFAWPVSDVKGMEIQDILNGKAVTYVIEELNSSLKLSLEGGRMRHCVGTYDDYCKERDSAIFSMRRRVPNKKDKILATIEVEFPQRKITQAKAKCNEKPSALAMDLLSLWAEEQNLKVDRYL